jgi:trk system potassium uptake protein TrkA
VAAVTNGDNSNILTARIARMTYEVPHVVARIYDPRRALIYQRLGIPTVATVSWATDQVLRRLMPGEVKADWSDPSGKVAVVERGLPPSWAGKKLSGLNEPGRFWLTAVTRLGAAKIVDTGVVGQEGDVLTFTVATDAIDALTERLEAGKDH